MARLLAEHVAAHAAQRDPMGQGSEGSAALEWVVDYVSRRYRWE